MRNLVRTTKAKKPASTPSIAYSAADRKMVARIRELFVLQNIENVVDEPLREGMAIKVVKGDGTRRKDLIGQSGEIMKIIVTTRGDQTITFRLRNGESVTSREIWWKRDE